MKLIFLDTFCSPKLAFKDHLKKKVGEDCISILSKGDMYYTCTV